MGGTYTAPSTTGKVVVDAVLVGFSHLLGLSEVQVESDSDVGMGALFTTSGMPGTTKSGDS